MVHDGMLNEVKNKMIELHTSIEKLNDGYSSLWKEEMFLAWQWWLNVLLLVGPWVIWLILRKKESTNRLLIAGLFVYVITSTLDSMGVAYGLWFYLYTPLPYIHTFFMPWDLSSFPVMVMLLIQYKPNFSPLLKALFFSLICAFVFEPLFIKLDVYVPLKWELYYGVPVYIVIYLIAHRVSRRGNFHELE